MTESPNPASQPTTRQLAIRTPPAPQQPRINGPRVVGAKPGRPFQYQIPVSGQRPIKFTVQGLPEGLRFSAATGLITGTTAVVGQFPLSVTAKNGHGIDLAIIRIHIGDQIALTPPMGWNNYNAFRMRIDDKLIRAEADAMVISGLADHGYSYINIDDGWQGDRDADGNIRANKKFPDMKSLGEYIHSKGLKFGLYSSPGPKTCAGYAGSYGFEANDVRTYASWGVDYLKYDWCYYDAVAQRLLADRFGAELPAHAAKLRAIVEEKIPLVESRVRPRPPEQSAKIKELSDAFESVISAIPAEIRQKIQREVYVAPYRQFGELLIKSDRDIVYSLCQYGMENVVEWGPSVHANLWRTTRDITPNWAKFQSIINQQVGLEKFASPGRWNDPDMLEIGNGPLTPDEMHTQMTQWCILSSPLLIGCDLTKMDDLVLSVLTNDEVIAINQDELGQQGYRVYKSGVQETWVKPLSNNRFAVALFNRGDEAAQVSFDLAQLKMNGRLTTRDLWRQRDVGEVSVISANVGPHGAELFSVSAR